MSNIQGGIDQIVTDSLVLYVDAANHKSYISGSGGDSDSTTYSLVNNLTGSVSSSVVYNTDNLGSWILGENGKINCQNPYPITYTDITFACWVFVGTMNYSGAPYGTSNDLVCKWDSGADKVLRLQISGSTPSIGYPQISVFSGGGTETNFVHSERVFKANWYYIVGTHSNTSQKLGISFNGEPFELTDYSGGVKVLPIQAKIGGIDAENSWSGKVSCVQLYNKTLSNSEVAQNYNALKYRFNL